MGPYEVVAIGLNWEGKWAFCSAAGYSYKSRYEAEQKLKELLERYKSPGNRPDFWSTSLRLEIWTSAQFAAARRSGEYAYFYP